jgi:hypothetical protein
MGPKTKNMCFFFEENILSESVSSYSVSILSELCFHLFDVRCLLFVKLDEEIDRFRIY